MPPIWTDVTREFVRLEQWKAYARAARSLGLGYSAEKGYAALAIPPRPALQRLSETQADQMGLTAEERAQFDELAAQIDARYRSFEIPTQFEDPTMYPSLAMIFDAAYDRLEASYPLDPLPLFATSALGDVNALMKREPETNTPVIFFDVGLFRFLQAFGTIAGWAIPVLSREQLSRDEELAAVGPVRTMPMQAFDSFTDVFRRFVFAGTARTTEADLPYPEHNRSATMLLLTYMEHFVMGHELAHIVLRHGQGSMSRDEAWQQEYDADEVGVALVTGISRDMVGSGALGFWAAEMALTGLHLLDRALAVAEYGDRKFSWISQTHPDPLSRMQRLRENPEIPPEMIAGAGNLRATSQAAFQKLWELAAAQLILDRNGGRRPSVTWKQYSGSSFAAV